MSNGGSRKTPRPYNFYEIGQDGGMETSKRKGRTVGETGKGIENRYQLQGRVKCGRKGVSKDGIKLNESFVFGLSLWVYDQ